MSTSRMEKSLSKGESSELNKSVSEGVSSRLDKSLSKGESPNSAAAVVRNGDYVTNREQSPVQSEEGGVENIASSKPVHVSKPPNRLNL